MDTPLNASATSAGALLSSNTFVVPPYQREYAWEADEVREFWDDLRGGLEDGSYFLGLLILTDEDNRKHVVDGQQRLLTITLLAACLYHEAVRSGRSALADRIQADFLTSIDYETDQMEPRVRLTDSVDDAALQSIVAHADLEQLTFGSADGLPNKLHQAARQLQELLRTDLSADPFKRLGLWTDFLTNKVYLAVFVHPNPASAYRVFEVINTRGRELTTADLLKNYVLNQTSAADRAGRYDAWQSIARPLQQNGPSTLVQFIRHIVTLHAGHVLPRDLFDFLAERDRRGKERRPPSVTELMDALESRLPLYLQMLDPTVDGPANDDWLGIFSALQDLNVITVRPLLMAISDTADATEGMRRLLQLVVRRIVVGNLGTGNVERRFGEAARRVVEKSGWREALAGLGDLNPTPEEFVEQLRKRSYNKGALTFLRRSIVQASITPDGSGYLHLIRPRQANEWIGFPEDDFTYWGSTLGNSFLAKVERRPKGANTFQGFKMNLLADAEPGEDVDALADLAAWSTEAVEARGRDLANHASTVWY